MSDTILAERSGGVLTLTLNRPDALNSFTIEMKDALLAALGNDDELALHTRATRNTGATPEDIAEAMLHVAVYAGVPRANHAFKIVKQTLQENP